MHLASSSGWRRTTMNTGQNPDAGARTSGAHIALIDGGEEAEDSSRILGQFLEEVGAWRLGHEGEAPADSLLHLSLRLLHWRLKRSATAYRLALEAARLPRVSPGEDWHRQVLIESDDMRLGLVTVHPGKAIALGEEGPPRYNMSLVVSGGISLQRVPLLDLCTDDAEIEIFKDSRQDFGPGEIVNCSPQQALTHRLEATAEPTVILEAMLAR